MDGRDEQQARRIEETIAQIWKTELRVAEIGADDDFFVYGDSLNMLNMLFQVGQSFGFELTPGALFENSTLRAFSLVVTLGVESRQQGEHAATDGPLVSGSI
jgi:acyl carrier protein